ncbi:MAG: MarR family transcriptional regulator [Acidobacteria bacterium]|nr:MarR family transcriptional regulator [Acidobacteriota bacterium]
MSKLSSAGEKFILHWGEMGTRWGVNRSVAQVHALLYVSPNPLHAEEIADTLSVARSNVSTSLRELQGWGLVRVVHLLGDRRDHFESMHDVWEMFHVILDERKRREIDPTLQMLRSCVTEIQQGEKPDKHMQERMTWMLEFFEGMTSLYAEARRLPPHTLRAWVRGKGKVRRWIDSLLGSD